MDRSSSQSPQATTDSATGNPGPGTGRRHRRRRRWAWLILIAAGGSLVGYSAWLFGSLGADWRRARQAARSGDWDEVERSLSRLEAYPHLYDIESRRLRITAAMKRRDLATAARVLGQLTGSDAEVASYRLEQGRLFLELDRLREAERAFLVAAACSPASYAPRKARVGILGLERRAADQEDALWDLFQHNPSRPEGRVEALCLLARGGPVIPAEALRPGEDEGAALERAVRADPDTPHALAALAYFLRNRGKLDEARRILEPWHREYGDAPPVGDEYVQLLLDEGRNEEAGAILENPDPAGSGPPTARRSLLRGIWNAAQGRHAEAVDAFRAAVERDPRDPEPRHRLAQALRAAGRGDEGRARLRLGRGRPRAPATGLPHRVCRPGAGRPGPRRGAVPSDGPRSGGGRLAVARRPGSRGGARPGPDRIRTTCPRDALPMRPRITWRLILGGLLAASLAGVLWWTLRPGLDLPSVSRTVSDTPRRTETRASNPPSLPATPAEPETSLRFRDEHEKAGLTEPHFEAADGRFRLVESMGSGVGLIDHDGDGWLDIFVAQGCPIPLDPKQAKYTSRLYRNRRDGTFADVTAKAGVGFNGYGQGVAVGDYDGDGRLDLYVSGFGPGALYRNLGNGTFRDETARAGVAGGGWATSCAFADLDGDGDLDLYVCHYLADTVDAEGNSSVRCNATPGRIGYCPPDAFQAEPDVLYRNNGDGTFTDVSRESGIASVAGKGLGLVIADLDDDGKLDIFVANDQTPNFLFRNLGGLRFEEAAVRYGVAYSESGQLRSGMGVAAGDYDGDGRLDLLVTNFYEEGDTLYRNVGPGDFQVTTAVARLTAPSRGTLGFGAGFLDADDDGRLDLFVANGHLNDVRPLGMPYRMPPHLFRNDGRSGFRDASAGAGPYFREAWLGRGAAFGDLDNDGGPDIVVTHLGRPPAVLINETTPRGHFLGLSLSPGRGAGPCVGARVTAECGGRRVVRDLVGGTSYLSASDSRILIGLSDHGRVDRLEVRWPSGASQEWRDVQADRWLEATEGRRDLRPAAGGKPEPHP
ncbi:MAG: FG-GAP-like repeat-containing protein [Isosphaeraceae bacterium]